MPSRDLPPRPHIDHLKHEAKALLKAARAGDPDARARAHATLGDQPLHKLSDAQRVIAREYGFPTWTRLAAHVRASRGERDAIDAFLAAVQQQDAGRALAVLHAAPGIAQSSLHVAAVLGLDREVARIIAADPRQVSALAGEPAAQPLLFLGYSPFHGESAARDAGLLASARILLDAGADPNTRDGRYGVPVLYAVTGQRSVLPIATLLLDAGANPTDGESIFHAAEHFHEKALELLLARGAQLNHVGEWGNTALYFLLRWHDVAREPKVGQGIAWLLAHGADPNLRSGKEEESALHVAARRGQSTELVRELLDHGADVNARREDGSTAWLLARRAGHDDIATLLERAGATTQPLTPLDELLAACSRGDAPSARRLAAPELFARMAPSDRALMLDAAASDRVATAFACLAAGFPLAELDLMGATALHHAAIHGRAPLVRALVSAGADVHRRDTEHHATPLGWACFGADFFPDSDGDFPDAVRALLEAGAEVRDDQRVPQHAGVRAVLEGRGSRN